MSKIKMRHPIDLGELTEDRTYRRTAKKTVTTHRLQSEINIFKTQSSLLRVIKKVIKAHFEKGSLFVSRIQPLF